MQDLPELPDVDTTNLLGKKLGPRRDDFSLFNIFRTLRDNLLLCLGTDLLTAISCFISPLSLQLLLAALEGDESKYSPWLYMVGLAVKPALDQILKDSALFFSSRSASFLESIEASIRLKNDLTVEQILESITGSNSAGTLCKDA